MYRFGPVRSLAKNKQILDSKLPLEKQLNIELHNLKEKMNRGHELDRVIWLPGKKILNPEGKPLDGEVKGSVVYIYSENNQCSQCSQCSR